MKIETTRFGTIEYTHEDHLIHFRDGMIGLSSLKKYILVESTASPLILWLQSIDDAGIAFPVIEPWFFKRDYKIAMTDADRICLGLAEGDRTKAFVVMTVPSQMEGMTVNMKAPVVINLTRASGAQVVQQDKALEIRTPAFEDYRRAIVSIPTEVDAEIWHPVSVRTREVAAEATL
jgi:flagellar assembly factor FliW